MNTTRTARIRKGSQDRREQQRQEVRQAILDAAANLFLERGYQGFSLRQVAERIGYSATTIYLHFESKDDLLFTVADEGFVRFGTQLAAAAVGVTEPLERLEAIGRAYITFGVNNPAYYQLMFMDRGDFLLGYRAGERKPRLGTLDIVEQTIREGMACGAIRPGAPVAFADALWAATHGVVAMQIAFPVLDAVRVAAAADAVLLLIVAGLRA